MGSAVISRLRQERKKSWKHRKTETIEKAVTKLTSSRMLRSVATANTFAPLRSSSRPPPRRAFTCANA